MPDDHRERLERLRDQLHDALELCSSNMLPQLASQYRATLADIAELTPTESVEFVEGSVDDFTSRRARRVSEAAPVPVAPGEAI